MPASNHTIMDAAIKLNMMVVIFDKMKDERKNNIIKKANQFIRDNTT